MRILYAEDEKQLSMAVTEILQIENYDVEPVYDGEEAWEKVQNNYYDAVVLDVMMPKMDGIKVLSLMRENNIFTPVLMLTAKTTAEDRIDGLSVGADDYLGKPFVMKEFLARLNSIIRRSSNYKHSVLKHGNITLNCDTNELKSNNSSLMLSVKESELLELFIKQNGASITLSELSKLLWSEPGKEENTKLYISYLKNKLSQIKAEALILSENDMYCFTRG